MDSTIKARFDLALKSGEQASLMNLVRQFQAEGYNQVEIYHLFNDFLLELKTVKREENADRVADTMDFIVGFCSSHTRLFPDYLTNEEIDDYKRKI